jgi:DNA-binding transcriptional MerR regulator
MTRVEEKAGISYRQLHSWSALGYLKPEGGNGTRYKYSASELRIARITGHLVRLGFQPRPAAELTRKLIDSGRGGSLELVDSRLKVSGTFASALRRAQQAA